MCSKFNEKKKCLHQSVVFFVKCVNVDYTMIYKICKSLEIHLYLRKLVNQICIFFAAIVTALSVSQKKMNISYIFIVSFIFILRADASRYTMHCYDRKLSECGYSHP